MRGRAKSWVTPWRIFSCAHACRIEIPMCDRAEPNRACTHVAAAVARTGTRTHVYVGVCVRRTTRDGAKVKVRKPPPCQLVNHAVANIIVRSRVPNRNTDMRSRGAKSRLHPRRSCCSRTAHVRTSMCVRGTTRDGPRVKVRTHAVPNRGSCRGKSLRALTHAKSCVHAVPNTDVRPCGAKSRSRRRRS